MERSDDIRGECVTTDRVDPACDLQTGLGMGATIATMSNANRTPTSRTRPIELVDLHPAPVDFRIEVLRGLTSSPKSLPPKFFYDEAGSRLFEQITQLPEYYPTRTELALLEKHAPDIVAGFGPDAALIEFGSGSSRKVKLLLDAGTDIAVYMPVDISRDFLIQAAEAIAGQYPDTVVVAVCADYTQLPVLPEPATSGRRIVFFPGSTVGNLEPSHAKEFLTSTATLLRPGDAMLIGVDLIKDTEVLNRAYNDAAGVTAEFNLNLLQRINSELGADFDLDRFEHVAMFVESESRIEMHLRSTCEQDVNVGGERIHFAEGETIHTENSYKYGDGRFRDLVRGTGFSWVQRWADDREWFALHWLEVEERSL